MPNSEYINPAENPPAESGPPPKAARSKKPNGEDVKDGLSESPVDQGADFQPIDVKSGTGPAGETTPEDLDADEEEYRRLRRDLPNVTGAAAAGIVAISVVKAPPKNEFFRTMKGFRPIVDLVTDQVRLDQKYYAVDPSMTAVLTSIGIAWAPHTLYLIMTAKGALRVIPVRCPEEEGDRNEYAATKELALREAEDSWLRIYTDMENTCYRMYYAPKGRFQEPVPPPLTPAKIVRLCFRDRGYLIDTPAHPRFLDWVARKPSDDGR
jgi:hypothetical protein